MTPVNRLPPEVLGEILRISMQHDSMPVDQVRSNMVWNRPPLSTCHLWRVIVLNLPAVWSRVYISGATSLEEITTWAHRAGNYPLNVHLDFPSDDEPTASEIVLSSWNFLSTRQVHSLHVTGQIDPAVMFPLKGNTAQLQTLELDCGFSPSQFNAPPAFTIFPSQVPDSLKTLDICPEDERVLIAFAPIATQSLSKVEELRLLGEFKPVNASEVLATCRSLKFLDWEFGEPLGGPPIMLPNLERLKLYVPDLLQSLELPRVHTLNLSVLEDHDFTHLSRLQGLKTLTIGRIASMSNALAFLASIAHVMHLKLPVSPASSDIMNALGRFTLGTAPGTLSVPCPDLRVLESSFVLDFALLKPLVDRRVSPSSPPLEIWIAPHLRPKDQKWETWMEKIHWQSHQPL
ncbi:hypothetical protein DL93DRAFT_109233 [Clavulina sp. PMI_390]|nr:hypothetical protein DL93DRAFT_109233 [Clavulina sp. PMI_390]